ncbi:MAG TPA: hypothetical protein PKC43_10905 [Phycisphaerales bacterium]|nr:hypothetical protein [Phycisphaerales bacterium]HMP37942.1 hypothetical protein [Phycisphaerales bacterium]
MTSCLDGFLATPELAEHDRLTDVTAPGSQVAFVVRVSCTMLGQCRGRALPLSLADVVLHVPDSLRSERPAAI